MKVRFLFHKPIGERGIGKVIVGLTWFYGLFYNWKVLKYNYSHEEMWIESEGGRFENHARDQGGQEWFVFIGQCFSSTTRGNANGVRFAPAIEVLKHPERWDYIECDVKDWRLEVALEEANKLVDAKYDFIGILGFIQPIAIQDDQRWYCSEICDWLKVLLRIKSKRSKRISPRRAAYLLAKKYGEPKPLIGE